VIILNIESLESIHNYVDTIAKHQLEEAQSQEAPDDNSPHAGNALDFGGEENTGLQVCY
jgi:hypothetical protein